MFRKYLLEKAILFFIFIFFIKPAGAQNINHWETVVMASDSWRYFLGNSEPPADWAEPGFNDITWFEGPGGIGYGDNDDATVIAPVGSVYLRTKFNVIDKQGILIAALHVDFDDGFVAYLNGHEIARANMGPIGIRPKFNDFAIVNTYEAQLPTGGTPALFILLSDTISQYLNDGENVLALQVHNCNATSSDLSSTTFLSFGICNSTRSYRPTPSWFGDPVQSFNSNLPLVVIETNGQEILNDSKITAWCKVIDNGPGQMNNFFQDGTDYKGNIGIRIRGQSSQMFPKKSYTVELWSASGADTTSSLLGMPSEEDWVLHAHYSDKSMLRNALTYHLSQEMGTWQPRFRYCNVYLDNSFVGIYLLMESIKRGPDRVDISKLKADEVIDDDLTGGYILKVDKTTGLTSDEYFISYPTIRLNNTGYYNFTYVYPDWDQISDPQSKYIKDYVTELQNALNGYLFKDPVSGFRKYMDMRSFADYQIIQELTNNVDGYRYSTFFYKDKESNGGKLHAGPEWDFDLGYGNLNYSAINLSTSGWLYPRFVGRIHWWSRMMEDVAYRRIFVFRWRELRRGPFKTDSVMAFIDSTVNYLGVSVNKNFEKWPILGQYVWPNYFIGQTYQEEVAWLKKWVTDRITWMDNNMNSGSELVDNILKPEILLFPNPVEDEITLLFLTTSNTKITLEFYDIYGKKVEETYFNPEERGYQEVYIRPNNLVRGTYILKIRQGSMVIGVKKIVKI